MGYRVKPFTMAVRDNSTQQFIDVGLLGSDVDADVIQLQEDVSIIKEELSEPLNILSVGGKNDGSEDVGALINQYTAEHSIYLPPGEYLVETPIVLKHSLFGYFGNHIYPSGCTYLNSTITSGSIITINESETPGAIHIEHMLIEANSHPVTAINFVPSVRVYISCYDLHVNHAKIGLNLAPIVGGSRWVDICNISLTGPEEYESLSSSLGIAINSNCNDGEYRDIQILGFHNGMRIQGGGNKFIELHIYCANGNVPSNNRSEFFAGTICIDCYTSSNMFDNIYLDTALQGMVQRSGHSVIGNLEYWNDGWFDSTNRTDGTVVTTRDTATVAINNCIIGGNSNTVKISLFSNSFITVNNFKCLWSSYYSNYILPMGRQFISSKTYSKYTTTSAGYYEIARIKGGGNGNVRLAISYGSGYSVIHIRFTNRGSLNTIKKIDEEFTTNHYYKMDGDDLVIFGYTSSNSSQNHDHDIELLTFGGTECGVVNYQSYPQLVKLFQATNEGLTLIGT